MAMPANPQVEADRRLLQYKNYEDYLDSLVTNQDRCYLQNIDACRAFAELGYRSCGETLSRKQFETRMEAVLKFLHPLYIPYVLASEGIETGDNIQRELSYRERPNRLGILSTIIFLRQVTPAGYEISGYIDYSCRLKTDNWQKFFVGKKLLKPQPSDLGYYNWKFNRTSTNNSENYKVYADSRSGLRFQNRFDRKFINVNPSESDPGPHTTRTRVISNIYKQVVLFDHLVRQRV